MLLIVGCLGLVGTSVMVWSISGWPVDQVWMEFGVSLASVAVPFVAIVPAGVSPSSPGDSAVNAATSTAEAVRVMMIIN